MLVVHGRIVRRRNGLWHQCQLHFTCCAFLHSAQVLEVVAGHRGIEDQQQLAAQVYSNTLRLFFPADSTAA